MFINPSEVPVFVNELSEEHPITLIRLHDLRPHDKNHFGSSCPALAQKATDLQRKKGCFYIRYKGGQGLFWQVSSGFYTRRLTFRDVSQNIQDERSVKGTMDILTLSARMTALIVSKRG